MFECQKLNHEWTPTHTNKISERIRISPCLCLVPDCEHGEYGAVSQVSCCSATVMSKVGMKRLLGFVGPYFRYLSNGSRRVVGIIPGSYSG